MTRFTRTSLLFVAILTFIFVKFINSATGEDVYFSSAVDRLTEEGPVGVDVASGASDSSGGDDESSNDSPEEDADAEDALKSPSTIVTSTALPSTIKVSTSTLPPKNGPTTASPATTTVPTTTTRATQTTSASSSSSTNGAPTSTSPSTTASTTTQMANLSSITSMTRDAKTTTAPSTTSTTPMTITLTYTASSTTTGSSGSSSSSTSTTTASSTVASTESVATRSTRTTTTTEEASTSESTGEDESEDDSSDGEGEGGEDGSSSPSPKSFVEKTIRVAVDQVKPILNNLEKELSNKDKGDDDIHLYRVVDDFGKLHTYTSSVKDTIEILNRISQFTSLGIDAIFKETIPYITSIGYESNISSPCLASMLKLLTGLRKQEIWAFRLIDSFGRIAPGTFDGTVTNFGEYHECIDVDFPSDFEGLDEGELNSSGHGSSDHMGDVVPEEKVVGKYCLMRVDIPMPPKPRRLHIRKPVINVTGTNLENTILQYISRSFDSLYTIDGFRFGVCLPSTCSADEITSLINKVLIPITKTPILIGPDKFCDTKNDSVEFNAKQKIALAILIAFTSVVVTSTLLDILRMVINSSRLNDSTIPDHGTYSMTKSSLSSGKVAKALDETSSSSSSGCCDSSVTSDHNNNSNNHNNNTGSACSSNEIGENTQESNCSNCIDKDDISETEVAEASITADRRPIDADELLIAPKVMTSQIWKVILSFSIIHSTKKLFHIREHQAEDTLSAVHGMRILSMIWIIIGHTYCFGGFYKLLWTFKRLNVDGITNPSRLEYQPLINTFLLVDTFFFLGGVVLIYVALPMLRKHKGKFNYFIYAVHRWVRLTPAMLGSICFITIMPALGKGPYWKQEMTWQSEGCQKNWWMNLLYINNWVYPVDEMCGGMTWFIAADYQIYLFLAPVIFFAYYKSSALGIIVNLIILITGMISTGVSTYINDMAPTFGIQHTVDLTYLHEYAQFGYFPTYHHIAPYAVGTFIGYLIVRHLDKPIRLSLSAQILGWIVSPICSIYVLLCTREWNDYRTEDTPSLMTSVVFSVLQRVLWTVGIAWVSFVCAIGQGGIVNTILSSKIFIPFSRLSYSIYMVHLIPIFLRANSLKYTRPWDDYEFISWGFFNILLGIFAAYILFAIFESPINSLEKLIFRGGGEGSGDGGKKKVAQVNNGHNFGPTQRNQRQPRGHHHISSPNGRSQVSKNQVKSVPYKQPHSMSTFSAYKLKGPFNGSTTGLTNNNRHKKHSIQLFTLPSVSSSFGHLYSPQSVPSYPCNNSYNVHLKFCRQLPYDCPSQPSMSDETAPNFLHQNFYLSTSSTATATKRNNKMNNKAT